MLDLGTNWGQHRPCVGVTSRIGARTITDEGLATGPLQLRQDVANHFATTDGSWAALGVADFGVGFIAEAVEERCGQVLRCDEAFAGLGALLVRRAVDLPAFDSATRQGDRENMPPVVPPATRVEPGGSAKFRDAQNQRLIE